MPLLFPYADHIPLRNPPLQQVICQIRFPEIFKIAERVEPDFQDMIRERFPKYAAEQKFEFRLLPGQPAKPIDLEPQVHRFQDRDETRMLSLGVNFWAVSTTKYQGWGNFADDIGFVAEQVLQTYKIPYLTRVGIRYINALNKQTTGLTLFDPDVLALLRPELTILLQKEEIRDPYLALSQIHSRQNEGEFAFRFGISQQGEAKEPSFMLDFDRYIEEDVKLDTDTLLELSDRYHAEIYNAFRWCIVDDALRIFEPTDKPQEMP